MQQVITAQQTQITQGKQAMAQVQSGISQWAILANAISRKVQTLSNPGTYTSDRAKFHKWWTKMKVWIRAHDTVLTLNFDKCTAVWSRMEGPIAGRYVANRMNECTVLTLNFDKCTAIWSRMEGPIAGRYMANRMNECMDRGIWPDWGLLKDEIEAHFSPQTNVKWS